MMTGLTIMTLFIDIWAIDASDIWFDMSHSRPKSEVFDKFISCEELTNLANVHHSVDYWRH